jgi:hypothetical protein
MKEDDNDVLARNRLDAKARRRDRKVDALIDELSERITEDFLGELKGFTISWLNEAKVACRTMKFSASTIWLEALHRRHEVMDRLKKAINSGAFIAIEDVQTDLQAAEAGIDPEVYRDRLHQMASPQNQTNKEVDNDGERDMDKEVELLLRKLSERIAGDFQGQLKEVVTSWWNEAVTVYGVRHENVFNDPDQAGDFTPGIVRAKAGTFVLERAIRQAVSWLPSELHDIPDHPE